MIFIEYLGRGRYYGEYNINKLKFLFLRDDNLMEKNILI